MKKRILIVLIFILIVIICILGVMFGIKFKKVSSLLEKMDENNKVSNMEYISENGDLTTYHYKKDGKIVTVSEDNYWYTGLETNYFVSVKDKTYIENVEDMEFNVFSFDEEIDTSFLNKLSLMFSLKIKNEKFEETDCYYVEMNDGTQYWIEKETGYILKTIQDELNTIYIKDITLNSVTDEDVELPDLSEYTLNS